MISATEAVALFIAPPFTEKEIDDQIRRAATSREWTCFDKNRLSEESRAQLTANGFTVQLSGCDYIVGWEKVAVPDLEEAERLKRVEAA